MPSLRIGEPDTPPHISSAAFLISRNVGITGEVFYRANLTDIEGQPEALDTNEFGFRFGIAAFVY